MITLTDKAAVKVKELLAAEGADDLALRVAVRPGGCSGFSYEMFFDGDIAEEDVRAEVGGVSIVVDPAYEYAEGLGYELTIGEKKQKKKFAKSDQFAPELVHFAKCVRANRRPEPSGVEGLIDVAIIEAIHRSINSGSWALVEAPSKRRRPTLRQEDRRPAVPSEPLLVQAESGHR